MKLAYISHSFIPSRQANSVQVMKMCHAFASLGNEVTLYCRQGEKGEKDNFSRYGVENSFALTQIDIPRIKFITRFLYANRILKDLKQQSGDMLIFGRDFYSLGYFALRKWYRHPVAFETHHPPNNALEFRLQRAIFRSPNFRQLVSISQALADEYLKIFGKDVEGKITVAHDGADLRPGVNGFSHEGSRKEAFKVGYIGSLYPGKGMEMISQLATLARDYEFHVVGGTEEQISHWKGQSDAENLIFHGFVNPGEIFTFMDRFDVMLAPYQANVLVGKKKVDVGKWMSPLKIFEYMSAGKPIISTDLPVLREFLHDGKNAMLAEAGDPEVWLKKLKELNEDPQLLRRLGENAKKDFESTYTWEKRARTLLMKLS